MEAADLLEFDELAAETGLALWPATITLGGVVVAAAVVPPRQGSLLSDFSQDPQPAELVARVLKSMVPNPPAENAALVWNSAKWKIRSVSGGDGDANWTLRCEPSP